MADSDPMRPNVGDVIDAIAMAAWDSSAPPRLLRFASVTALDGSGRPRLKFEGESTATAAGWAYSANYAPTVGDRVAVIKDGASGLVICKVTY